MAKYYTSVETIGAIDGVEEPIQVRNVTITNVDNGVWNGLLIEAKNFAIANGHLASEANETYVWNGLASDWTDGVDDEVEQVIFTNNGVIGTQDNTVNMAVTLKAFTPSENDLNINITLVESTNHPIYSASHPFLASFAWGANDPAEDALHTVTTSTAYTEADLTSTGATYSGTILTDESATIVVASFVASDEHYYTQLPNVNSSGVLGAFGAVSGQIEGEVYQDNRLIRFDVRMEFNWNALGNTDQGLAIQNVYLDDYDSGGNWAAGIGVHPIFIAPVPVAIVGDRIHSVSYPPSLTSSQGEIPIRVFGSANAPYKLSIEKKTSTTSTVTAASNGYYNFDTRAFQTAVTSLSSTCDAKGVNVNYVLLPDASSDTRYDVTVSGIVAGSATTLNSNVPQKAGDATIIKNGVNTITIKPVTYNSARYHTDVANGNLNLSVSKSAIASGSGPGRAKPTSVIFKGGTGGSVSTRLVLEDNPSGVFAGMVITGSGIKHGTTVTAISKNVVTLSQSCTVAAATDIKFTTNTANLFPFSFLIARNVASDVISVTSGADLKGAVGGLTSVKTNTTSPSTRSTSQAVTSTKGIVSGMTITGTEVKTVAGEKLTVATAPSSLTAIVFSGTQSFSDGASLRFSGGNASADVSLHSIQANMSGTSVWITGYLEVNEIKATADVAIYIDDIISYP